MVTNIVTLWTSDKKHQAEVFKTLYNDLNMLGTKTKIVLDKNDFDYKDCMRYDLLVVDIFIAGDLCKFVKEKLALNREPRMLVVFDDKSFEDHYDEHMKISKDALREKRTLKMTQSLFYLYGDIVDIEDIIIDGKLFDRKSNDLAEYLLKNDEFKKAVEKSDFSESQILSYINMM